MQRSGRDEPESLRITIGGLSRAELRTALRDRGVLLNAYADTLIDHPVFDSVSSEEIFIVERSVDELGLADGATLPQIFATADVCGLALCPATTGPYLRLAMMDQSNAPDSVLSAGRSPAGALKVASARLSDDPDFPTGFYLRVVDHQPWLRGYRCDDDYGFSPDVRFAFQRMAGGSRTTPGSVGETSAAGDRA